MKWSTRKQAVTLRYWIQDTQESGHWHEFETIRNNANLMISSRLYDRAYILEDEEKEGNQPLEDLNDKSD